MITAIKVILGLFMLSGLVISLYGFWEIVGTFSLVRNSAERTRGAFTGYDREVVESRSPSPSPADLERQDFQDTSSIMSYPVFEFVDKAGVRKEIRESKQHVIERFKPGQEIEIILSPFGDHRIAGFYSLYVRDLCILAVGLCFILIPCIIWSMAIPSLNTAAGKEVQTRAGALYKEIASTKVGPVTVRGIVLGTGVVAAVIVIVSLGSALTPFLRQMRLGAGSGLIKALEHNRFDEARELILKKKGINAQNEYDQSPLILALEAGQADLARLLVEAGAEVNVKSKMYSTPLLVATRSGDLEMVRLLLARGARTDAPEDETPPVFLALIKGQDEIARVLIESESDLTRQYASGERRITVGDLTVMVKKPALTELVRRRGGVFTLTDSSR